MGVKRKIWGGQGHRVRGEWGSSPIEALKAILSVPIQYIHTPPFESKLWFIKIHSGFPNQRIYELEEEDRHVIMRSSGDTFHSTIRVGGRLARAGRLQFGQIYWTCVCVCVCAIYTYSEKEN